MTSLHIVYLPCSVSLVQRRLLSISVQVNWVSVLPIQMVCLFVVGILSSWWMPIYPIMYRRESWLIRSQSTFLILSRSKRRETMTLWLVLDTSPMEVSMDGISSVNWRREWPISLQIHYWIQESPISQEASVSIKRTSWWRLWRRCRARDMFSRWRWLSVPMICILQSERFPSYLLTVCMVHPRWEWMRLFNIWRYGNVKIDDCREFSISSLTFELVFSCVCSTRVILETSLFHGSSWHCSEEGGNEWGG